MSFLFGVIAASYDTSTPPPPPPPPPPPTCTPTCGSCSYTYSEWTAWSACVSGTQTRTRTVTCTQICTASDCSTYTQTSTSTETESQACTSPPPATTWYCSVTESEGGSTTQYQYTSSSDNTVCSVTFSIYCLTTGYPGYPALCP